MDTPKKDRKNLAIAVPDGLAIARLFGTLLDLDVKVKAAAPEHPVLDEAHILACYADDEQDLRAVVLADLGLTIGLGGALARAPVKTVEAAVVAHELSSAALGDVYEALNVFARLFNERAAGHVRVVAMNRAHELASAGLQSLIDSAWAHNTYDVEILGYASGKLTVFVGGANRRSATRIQHRARVDVAAGSAAGARETWDVGTGGLYVSDPNPLPVGAKVFVRPTLPGLPRPITLEARVAWRKTDLGGRGKQPVGFGIQLLTTTGQDFELYQAAVCSLARGPVGAKAPKAKAEPPPQKPARKSGPSRMAEPTTVLVVDDSKLIREQVGGILVSAGYLVVGAGDGEEALERFRAMKRVGLVVLDMNMPRTNGLEFMEQMPRRGSVPSVPVIVLTTELDPEMLRRAKGLGAKGWIVKPFRPEMLVAAVGKCAAGASAVGAR